ncbi:predicted protein [Chaetoceros tenuissimus]|uniref:Uncharacterized protein n=1 Tax=Chaetoceros tenuissimus TaxID=426638 RepID=A0AAD3H5A3_9STRA|nr:predicted protein [Chaetoceros tenuissimus]
MAATGHFKPSLEAYDYKAVEWVNFAWNNRKTIRMINEDIPLVKETETGYSVNNDFAVPEIDDIVDHDDAVKQQDTYDMYIGAEVLFPNVVVMNEWGKW